MAEPSVVYQDNKPNLESGGLTALQLALATYMSIGAQKQPFGINQDFLKECVRFCDPVWLNPLNIDYRTGLVKEPDLIRNVRDGISFIARGEDIYLLRRAEDCGPDEDRTELVFLGKRPDVADGTFAFYGFIRPGAFSSGAGGEDGGGGYGNLPPAVQQMAIEASGFAGDPGNPQASAAAVAAAVSLSLSTGGSVGDPEGAGAVVFNSFGVL